jgi:hypothetical protein
MLIDHECSFGKYLSKVDYSSGSGDLCTDFYITPIATRSLRKLLVITGITGMNDSVPQDDLNRIVSHLSSHYNISHREYKLILHVYHKPVCFEEFSIINTDSDNLTENLSLTEFEKLLE